MAPSDQMSDLASTERADRSCSGDMYAGDPIIVEVCVSVTLGAAPEARAAAPKEAVRDEAQHVTQLVREVTAGKGIALRPAQILREFRPAAAVEAEEIFHVAEERVLTISVRLPF